MSARNMIFLVCKLLACYLMSVTSEENIRAVEPRRFSFVEPGILAASAFPNTTENLQFLKEKGIGIIVSLTEEKEVNISGFEDQFTVVRIPVEDYTPPTLKQVAEFINTVLQAEKTDKAILVHCAGGLGRTGTMLSAYFVKFHGLSADAAIAHVRESRPGSVETEAQEELVAQYAQQVAAENAEE